MLGHESESDSESDESETEVEFEDDIDYLRSLDPKECKDQDHYRVLGLTTVRIKATDEQIKKAYRYDKYKTRVPSMIHSARSTFTPVAITILA